MHHKALIKTKLESGKVPMNFKSPSWFERRKLARLLRDAGALMTSYGPVTYFGSYYDNCEELGKVIGVEAEKLANNEKADLTSLWKIFAPTCDWDDAGGSLDLANEIFSILDKLWIRDK